MRAESKKTGNMTDSRKIFDDAEAAHQITEDEFIKVENIKGKLLMVAALRVKFPKPPPQSRLGVLRVYFFAYT